MMQKKTTRSWSSVRSDFPILRNTVQGKPLIYFDTAATAQKPQQVIDAMSDFYAHHYGTVHRAIYQLSMQATHRFHQTRHTVAKFLNAASAHEIVFTKGATESINLVAATFGERFLGRDDEVLITETEHHANIVPWQKICEQRGACLRYIPMAPNGELDVANLSHLITPRTKIVAVAHIANATGTVNPIEEIIQTAHEVDAAVLIDGAQAVAHQKVDVQSLDADFYVFSGHKMYGPTGIGILYGKQAWLEALPPYQCGGDMVETVTMEKTSFQKPPAKFEAGTPMIAQVMGLHTAIEYIEHIGLQAIRDWEQHLLATATQKIEAIPGLRILGTAPHKGPILQFTVEGVHPLDMGTLLDARGIALRTGHHCAQPTLQAFGLTASARISFGVYNTEEEVTTFVESLREVTDLLRG